MKYICVTCFLYFILKIAFASAVKDKKLKDELYTYLINNLNEYTIDSLGHKNLNVSDFPKSIGIASSICKTDSIVDDKTLVGIYEFRFTCFDFRSCIYFQYSNGKKEFFNVYKENFDIWHFWDQSEKFIKKHCGAYTEEEKIKTLEKLIKSVYANRSYLWYKDT